MKIQWLVKVYALLASTLMAASLSPLLAQVATGRISGRVTDATGAVVGGASVTIVNDATGVAQNVHSSSTGDYIFQAVNPGSYTLTAEASGFKQFVAGGIQAHIQDDLAVDIKLALGTVGQQVTVTAAAPLLQTADASVGQTVTGEQVNNLPLQSRDWTTLGLLASGTSTTGGSNNSEFNVSGLDWTQNDFRLNGIDDNVEVYGAGSITGASGNNGYSAIVPPPDAIQEFKLQSGNFSAEFGHSTGGIVNAAIKSGSNGLHGDAWEYVRNTLFNANDYFANQSATPRPAYHQNEFGFTAGGPVYIPKIYQGKNKTFFFADYQGTRINTPSSNTSSVPTASMHSSGFTNMQDMFSLVGGTKKDGLGRQFPLATILDPATTRMVAAGAMDPVSGLANSSGAAVYVRDPFYAAGSVAGITDFTGHTQNLNILPQSRIDQNAVKLLSLYPNPSAGKATFPNYYQFAAGTNNINQYDVRIDENVSDKDILFGVYSYSNETIFVPPHFPGVAEGQLYGDGPEQGPRYAIVFGYTHLFTPNLTNEFHAGYLHTVERLSGAYGTTLGIPAQYGIGGVPQLPGNGGLPPISIGGFSGLGGSGYMPTLNTVRTVELMDNVTKIYRAHTFKTGFQLDNLYAPIVQAPSGKGTFTFSGQYSDIPNMNGGYTGAADMLLTPTSATVAGGINNLGGLANYGFSDTTQISDQRYYIGAYFQDDWKASSRLTLNLGLRWDHYTPYQEVHGRQANFIETGGGAGTSGTYYIPRKGCATPTSSGFQSLLASYNIATVCSGNNAVGNAQSLNFAPRLGFAYRVSPQVVVRGGYGITYGALDNSGAGFNIGNNYPFTYTINYYAASSQAPLEAAPGQTAVLENALTAQNLTNPSLVNGAGLYLYGRQYNFNTPYQQTVNFAFQDQLTNHDAFTLGYVGTLGRHLDTQSSQNAPSAIIPPGQSIYDPTVPGHVPFPALGVEPQFISTTASSNYNSVQANYEHQLSAGLTLLANYTFSKCLSNARSAEGTNSTAYGGPFYGFTFTPYRAEWLPGFGKQGDYGLCASDTAQVVHASGSYELPFGRSKAYLNQINTVTNALIGGWVTNFIFSHQTGQPFTVLCPVSTTAGFACFADIVRGQPLYTHSVSQWLNPAAFANPPVATVAGQADYSPLGGTTNPVRGPGFRDLDMSLFKDFPIHESFRLQFRAEAFNLGNWHSFANPSANLNFLAHGFSAITASRGNPRILQLALKLYY